MNRKKLTVLILILTVAIFGWWLINNRHVIPVLGFVCGQDTVTDSDGNIYQTVDVAGFCWTRSHLKTTTFNNGEPIARPISDNDWRRAGQNRTGAFACYNNDPENCDIYGALYNAYAVDKGLCPAGWRVPSDQDWKDFEIALGMDPDEVDLLYWRGGDLGITLAGHFDLWEPNGFRNRVGFGRSGFNAEPAGYRMSTGLYSWLGHRANIWSSTIESSAWRRTIISGSTGGIRRTAAAKNFGFSVRCLKN